MNPNTVVIKDLQQSHKNNPKKIKNLQGSLVVFDFDGTLTTSKHRSSWQSVHEYFDTWETHGEIALNLFLEGKITYKEFCEADAYPWINRSEEEYQHALSSIELRDGVPEVINFFRNYGCKLAIISMGLSDIVKRTAQEYKFDYWIANDLIRKNNRITGEVVINVDMHQKGEILSTIREMFKIPTDRTIAIGDASADIEMFSTAHISFAIDPSSIRVAKSAYFVCKTQNLAEIISYFE